MAGSLSIPYHLIQDIHCINFLRLVRLLTRGATSVLTNLFKVYCPPSVDLSSSFDTTFSFTLFEERCHSQEFDTTLVFPLLREKCGLLPPPTGWNALPNDDDMSLSADIARIKCYRNQIYKHANEKEAKLTDTEFECCKENTVNSLRRIVRDYSGTDWEAVAAWEKSVGECLTSPITEEDENNVEKLKTWYLKDVEEEQLQSSETETTEQWGDAIKEVTDTRNGEGEGEKQYVGSKGDLKDVEREQLQSDKIETTKQSFDTIKGVTDERNEKEEKNDAGSNGYLEHVVEKHPQSTYVVIKEKYEEMKNLLIDFTTLVCYSSVLTYEIYLSENTLWENGQSIKEAAKKYHFAKGIEDVNSGRYIDAIPNFHRVLKSLRSEEVLLRARLENNIGCSYIFAKKPDKAIMSLRSAIQTMNCFNQTFENDINFTEITNVKYILKNNHACMELENGNSEEALPMLKDLYEEGKPNADHHSSVTRLNLVHVVMNYSQACLQSGKMENIVEVLQDILHGCHFTEEEYNLQLVVSVRLARILTVMGKRQQAEELVDLQEIDSLKIQKIIESDSMKPFSVIYTDDISRILVYNGERSKSKELLQTAIHVCQEMHFKEHPLVLSLEKTKEELFPTLVIEKAALALEEDNISRHKVAINVCVEYALQVLQHESDRESLLAELNALKSVASDEKSFADMYTSEKQLASSTQIPAVAFISTLYICAFLSQQEKSDNKVETYLRNQLARIESFCDDLKENAVSKFVISFLSDNRSCALSALCSLLETALLRYAHTCVVNICTTLVSCLSRGSEEDVSEVEWYKDYCGLLSYFVATNHVQISGKKITLYVIVTSGSGLKGPEEVGFLPDKKPLFKRIVLHDAESKECRSSCTQETNPKCFVFLRCHDLIDINDLRHINKTIIESTQSLESLPTNARHQRSLFIEVVKEIDPADVSGSCLQLNLLKCCFEGIDTDCHGPVNVPSVQNLYLQKLQKPLSFKNESDLAVFMAVFQYTFSNIRLVDVLHKTRKKMVCVLKERHFSLLTLHTKASTAYLTLHDVSDKCFGDGTIATEATHLIDVVIGDCFEKLCISSIDPKNPWRICDQQIDECPIIFAEEEDAFEKALKTNARVTAELEYLQTKTRSLNSRLKKLYDRLSEAENRVFLLQHFAHATFSDRNKMKAVENWITKKKTRQAGPKEGPSNDEDDELEEFLESISNDELAEFLAEIQRPDLVSVSLKDKTSDESREMSLNEDIEGAGCFTSSDKRRIVEEEKIEGANGKSLDQRLCNDDVEGKDSSDNLSWYFPLPESTQHFPSINIAAEQSELPILREEFTQTDSLSLVQEYKDVDVQTDPTQLTSEETLEKGIADFERDRAERQLRKSRLSQDVIAFKNRPRESAPGSSQGSIVTQTSGFFSGGTPRDSISSGSSLSESFSECSIVSKASSLGTEDVPIEGTQRASLTSSSLAEPWSSRYSIESKASSHGTEGVPIEGTQQASITSSSLPEPWSSRYSIESKASSHGTEGVPIEGKQQDSISSGSLPLESFSKCSIVSKTSSLGTEDVPSEGTPRDSIAETTEAEASGNEKSMGNPFSGFRNNKGTYRVAPEKEIPHSTVPRRTSLNAARESVNSHLENEKYDDMLQREKGISIAQEYGDKVAEMNVYMTLGDAHLKKKEYDDAISYSEKCLAIAQESGVREAEMNAYMMLGKAHLKKEEYDDAILYSEKCLAIAHESGHKGFEMNAYMLLGKAHLKKEEYDDAILYTQKCLAIAQESGHKMAEMTAYMMLGNVHLKKEEYDDAILYTQKCLAIAQESGHKMAEMTAYKMLGNVHLKKEEYDDAIFYNKKNLAIAQESGDNNPYTNEIGPVLLSSNPGIGKSLPTQGILRHCVIQEFLSENPKEAKEEHLDVVDGRPGDQEAQDRQCARILCLPVTYKKEDIGYSTCNRDCRRIETEDLETCKCSSSKRGGRSELNRVDEQENNFDDEARDGGKSSKRNSKSSKMFRHGNARTLCSECVESDGSENMLRHVIHGKTTFHETQSLVSKTPVNDDVMYGMCDDVTARRVVCNGETRPHDATRMQEFDGNQLAPKELECHSVRNKQDFTTDDVTSHEVVCKGKISTNDVTPRIPVRDDVTSYGKVYHKMSTNEVTPRIPVRDDVTSNGEAYHKMSTNDIKSRKVVSDGVDSELAIGLSTRVGAVSFPALGHSFSSYAKAHKHDESLTECITFEDKLQNSKRSRESSLQLLGNEPHNVTGTTNNEDAVSLDDNAGKTVSSFRNSVYMSLPIKALYVVSNTEKRSDRIHSLVFSNTQQDVRDKASLSVIKETDDSEDIDDIWNSQGARPKRIGLHGDYIVSGVDNLFLARHSNDSSLTRSVYSRTRVHNKHKPFSSLPVCSNEREELPSVARTWPICDDRLLTDQNPSSSVNDKSRLPYQGLPRETGKKPMRSFDIGRYPCKEQTKNEDSSKVQIYGNNLYTARKGHFDAKTSEKKKGKESMSDDLLSDAKGIAADDDGDSGGNDVKADGNGLRYIGKHEEAQKCFERALAIEEMEYDQNHPTLAITLSNLGNSLRDLGKHQEAQKCFERALAIQEMAYDQNHPTLATTLNNVAKSSEKAKGKDIMKHGVLSEAKGIAADDDGDVGIGYDGDGDDGKADGNGEAHGIVALAGSSSDVPRTISKLTLNGSHSDVSSTTGTPTLSGSRSDVTSTTGTPILPGSRSDVTSTTDTPTLPGSHSDVTSTTDTPTLSKSHSAVRMKGQSQVAFDNIHGQRSPNYDTFDLPPLFNTEHTSDGLTNLSPTQNTNNSSSSDDDLYKTADNSLESLESFEDQINRSRLTWSQMSESVRFEHDEDDEQEESLNEDMQTENQGETERRTLVAASGEGDEMNANRSEIKGKCKNGTNGKSVESGGRVMRWFNWAKNLGRTEKEIRETDLEKGATSLSQRQDFTREDMNTQTVDQLTSLSTQRVSADVYDASERELRIARAREREERNKKEKEEIERRLEASQKEKEQSSPSSPQPARLPVQESRNEWPCGHYKRKCSIKFPCCEQFYFCHRCHNDSDQCEKDNMKALNGTHLCCLVCNKEQEITENSHHCINCNTQLAEYFCSICKHFTGNEKTPYHCKPCGICRIHRDRSFHCDVCNVCLDVRLLDNHKCRPDSGHDECCICLEDAFGGCQILPCSHKVHRECAVAMLKNGVRKCPVCRHPLNLPLQR